MSQEPSRSTQIEFEKASLRLSIRRSTKEIEDLKEETVDLQAKIDDERLQQIQYRTLLNVERAKHRQFFQRNYSSKVTTSVAPHNSCENSASTLHSAAKTVQDQDNVALPLPVPGHQEFSDDVNLWPNFFADTPGHQYEEDASSNVAPNMFSRNFRN